MNTTYEGHDETGTVRAVVDAAGEVTDVTLAPGWHKSMDRRRLGPAALAAAREAGAAHLAAWAERVAAEPPAPANPPAFAAPAGFAPSTAMIDHVLCLVRRVEREQRTGAADDTMMARRPTRGRGSGGHVTVLVDHARVVEVQVDLETAWVRMAGHREIAAELRSAFRAAYAGARRAADTQATTPPATAELAALVADPEELVAALWGARR